MAIERKQFTFYRSYYESISALPDDEQLKLYKAICAYALNEELNEMSGVVFAMFNIIKPTLDSSRKKAENGAAGGHAGEGKEKQRKSKPKAKNSKNKAKENQVESESKDKAMYEEKQDESNSEIKNENEIENKIDIEIENKKKSFIPPTVEEAEQYCRECGFDIDAEYFVDYYTACGWMVGRRKMRDWRAAIRYWNKNQKNRNISGGGYKQKDKDIYDPHKYDDDIDFLGR